MSTPFDFLPLVPGACPISIITMADRLLRTDTATARKPRLLLAVMLAVAQITLLFPFPVLLQPCRCADDRENGCRCAEHEAPGEISACCAGHPTDEHACCKAAKPKANLLITAATCGGRRVVLGLIAEVFTVPDMPITLLLELDSSPSEPTGNDFPLTTSLESTDPPPRTS